MVVLCSTYQNSRKQKAPFPGLRVGERSFLCLSQDVLLTRRSKGNARSRSLLVCHRRIGELDHAAGESRPGGAGWLCGHVVWVSVQNHAFADD